MYPNDTIRQLIFLVAILVVGAGVRLAGLNTPPLLFDEAFSWRLASCDGSDLLARAARDNNPPLYYVLLKGWMRGVGESAAALRGLSAAWGVLAIAGAYLLAREACPRPRDSAPRDDRGGSAGEVGLLAAALVALSVFQIHASQAARMYGMGAALAVWSTWALWRALRRPTLPAWCAYAALAALFAHTHTYALLSLAGQGLFAAGWLIVAHHGRPGELIRAPAAQGWILATAAVAAIYAPWFPVLLRQRAQVTAEFWSRPLAWTDFISACYGMWLFPDDNARLGGPLGSASLDAWWATGLTTGLVLALCYRPRAGTWCVVCGAIAPLALAVAISSLGRNIFATRYMVFAHMFLLIGLALLISRLPSARGRWLIAAATLAGMASIQLDFASYRDAAPGPGGGGRAAARCLDATRQPGEPVIVSTPMIQFPLSFHARDRQGLLLRTDAQSRWPHYLGSAVLRADELISIEQMESIDAPRAWVVRQWSDLSVEAEAPMPDHWRLVRETRCQEGQSTFRAVLVAEYAIGPGGDVP
jgi:hypothetical protein